MIMNGYFSVFNPRGEKIADCGLEKDAVNLMNTRNCRWEGHYFQFVPNPAQIVDVFSTKALNIGKDFIEIESIKIEGQELPIQQSLPSSEQEVIDFQ
mgnify:CR=1 FL=1|tara:strand:+ start:3600 stop:3890 length:291 start_codon:yes stop_codon:yes gene_type:complete